MNASAPTDTAAVIAVHNLRGQKQPVKVTCLRPVAVVACEALPVSHKIAQSSGAGLAVAAAAAVPSVHCVPS
jgi:hypothetical protein